MFWNELLFLRAPERHEPTRNVFVFLWEKSPFWSYPKISWRIYYKTKENRRTSCVLLIIFDCWNVIHQMVDQRKTSSSFFFILWKWLSSTWAKNLNKRQWSGQVFGHRSAGIFNSSSFLFYFIIMISYQNWKDDDDFFGVSISTILKCHKDGRFGRHSRERKKNLSCCLRIPARCLPSCIVRVLFSFSCHARGLEEVDADSSVMGDSQWMSVSTPSLWAFKKNQEN